MKALGSQPLQYYSFTIFWVRIYKHKDGCHHMEMCTSKINSNYIIITRQMLMAVVTCETKEMLFINMCSIVLIRPEYKITVKTLKFVSRFWILE